MPHLGFRFVAAGLLALWAAMVQAHEVRPAIGDLTVADGRVELRLVLNAEAIVAGVSLDGISDTDETEASDNIDALRLMSPDEMTTRLVALVPQIVQGLNMTADGAPVALTNEGITVDPVGNPTMPRDTLLVLSAEVAADVAQVEVTWPREYGTLVLRQQGVTEPFTGYLSSGQSSGPISVAGDVGQSNWTAFVNYIPVGFEHILPLGLDHILFVLGLFFLSTRLGSLLWQVTAFTLAHTVTLALAALGYVTVSGAVVEPLIAASIVFVAVENIVAGKLTKWRPAVVFGFGLLHGLGFASVLEEFGLPTGKVLPSLIGFNVGVELGQLTVIAVAFLISLPIIRNAGEGSYRRFVAIPCSLIIALIGAYWFVERVFF